MMAEQPSKRVVITGCGLVSPLGNSPQKLWNELAAGRSGVGYITRFPAQSLPTRLGAEARDFTGKIEDFGPLEKSIQRQIKKALKLMCREIEMAVASAQMALAHAGLAPGSYDPDRTGAVFGCDYILTMPDEFADGIKTCMNGNGEFHFEQWGEKGLPKVTPLWLLKYLPNMPASHVAIYNDLRGPNNSLTHREAAANLAVGEAYTTIRRGWADTMMAAATGTRIHPLRTVHVSLYEECAKGGEPSRACRPFDLGRTGMVLGEGAATIVLEELQTARRRGARILGEVIGHGSSSVVDRNDAPDTELAMVNAMTAALRSAGLAPSRIGHVHAHGLSTRKGDAEEARAIRRVFADRPDVPVVAAKSYFGNLGAGAGMVELIASLLALEHGRLFRVLNYETPDPECPVHAVRTDDVEPGDTFLNVSITPQGQASAVVVRRFRE
jgi:3-oxoacyl-[acyl-carrier-protein] synthase II